MSGAASSSDRPFASPSPPLTISRRVEPSPPVMVRVGAAAVVCAALAAVGVVQAAKCSDYDTCAECTAAPECGQCLLPPTEQNGVPVQEQRCVAGNETGPFDPTRVCERWSIVSCACQPRGSCGATVSSPPRLRWAQARAPWTAAPTASAMKTEPASAGRGGAGLAAPSKPRCADRRPSAWPRAAAR